MISLEKNTLTAIEIPARFVRLCHLYGDGSHHMQTIASTSTLIPGILRPWAPDRERYMTDREWHVHLWNELSLDVFQRLFWELDDTDHTQMVEFDNFTSQTRKKLIAHYGLDD